MDFVRKEFRELGVKVSAEVVEQVVEGVGAELRELAAACSQLVADRFGDASQTNDGALPRNTLLVNAITDLHTVLAKDVDVEASRAAARRAKRTESLVDLSEEGGLATLEISRCVRTWHALNELTASARDSSPSPARTSRTRIESGRRPARVSEIVMFSRTVR